MDPIFSHTKIQQAQLPFQRSPPRAEQPAQPVHGECCMTRRGIGGATGHGVTGRRGDRMALIFMGNQLSRSSASRTTSHGSFLLFSLCHVVLLAGRALSYQVTCMWTWKHVNKMGIKTVTKECHSLKAGVYNLGFINRCQGDEDPLILCKVIGTSLHMHFSVKMVYSFYVGL